MPVIEPLLSILAEQRKADGNPTSGPILRGPKGVRLNLANLARRVVIHELKAAGLKWHGWYALRRGVATLVTSVEKSDAAKSYLRHSSAATTQKFYIKAVPADTLRAAQKVGALFVNHEPPASRQMVQ